VYEPEKHGRKDIKLIKIITKGQDVYSASCAECGCRFSYEHSDVHHNYALGGEYVSCPQCHHEYRHFGARGSLPNPYGSDGWSREATRCRMPADRCR